MKYTNYTQLLQEEIDNLKNSVAIKGFEFLVKNLLTKKTLGPHSFTGKFYQTVKQEIIPVLHKLFQKIDEEEILPKSCSQDHITGFVVIYYNGNRKQVPLISEKIVLWSLYFYLNKFIFFRLME